MGKFDMRGYAKSAGNSISLPKGSILFKQGDPGDCLYIVQYGVIELVIDGRVIDACGPNEVIGFMAVLEDDTPRTSTAIVKEAAEVSRLDKRKFRFMVDEVPYFALYIMDAMAERIKHIEHGM